MVRTNKHKSLSKTWLFVTLGFSVAAFLVRWADLTIPIIGTLAKIDPREIFVILGAALTGPAEGETATVGSEYVATWSGPGQGETVDLWRHGPDGWHEIVAGVDGVSGQATWQTAGVVAGRHVLTAIIHAAEDRAVFAANWLALTAPVPQPPAGIAAHTVPAASTLQARPAERAGEGEEPTAGDPRPLVSVEVVLVDAPSQGDRDVVASDLRVGPRTVGAPAEAPTTDRDRAVDDGWPYGETLLVDILADRV